MLDYTHAHSHALSVKQSLPPLYAGEGTLFLIVRLAISMSVASLQHPLQRQLVSSQSDLW
jgi:hypothetical protein